MTSIYQYNRNGMSTNTTNAGPGASNNTTSNARGRTESPSMRARYTRLTSGTTNDSSDLGSNRAPRTHQASRNPPERISANPAQSFSKVNAIATSYMNKAGLVSTATSNLTPRRYKVVEDPKSNVKALSTNLTKARLNEFDNHMQGSSLSSKPQKYLSTYSNLNQMQNHGSQQAQQQHQYTNGNALEDDFANSLYLNYNNQQRNQTSAYNIITHEPTTTNGLDNNNINNNTRYSHSHQQSQGSMGNSCAAHGSLLRAAQSKQVLVNGASSSQFYPAQQQQQPMVNGSYKIPTMPSNSSVSGSSSNSSSVHNAAAQSYYTMSATTTTTTSNNHQLDTDSNELTYKGIVGLKNLGNTCFMNCVLQCLSNTKCLLEYVLSNSYQSEVNTTMSVMKGSLVNSYASLIKQMWSGGNIVSLADFKSQLARFAPRFVGYAQQDAVEFLYYLINGLHEDVNLIRKKPSPFRFDEKAWDRMTDAEKSQEHWSMNLRTDNSRISDMFVGQLKSTLTCTKCDYKSPTYELFWHVAVPIPKISSIQLDDCIKLFMAEEILDGDNKPTCSRCNEKRRCTKRYTIEKLPKILVIHLKRFLKVRYNNKINSNVDYPIESLDMSKYLSHNVDPPSSGRPTSNKNCIYDLYGIALHSGTESSGHYVAYCRHPYRKKWNYFNDSSVREISKSSLQDSNAYILFYQLRS